MGYQIIASLSYKDIFDDYESVIVANLIADIPTPNSLEVIGYFLAQFHTPEKDNLKQLSFLNMWIKRLPVSIHPRIREYIHSTLAEPNANYNLINNISGLRFIELILEHSNNLAPLATLTPDHELKLFKAYLYCTQQWLEKERPSFNIPKIETEEDLIRLLLPTQLPFEEIQKSRDFSLQFIKAIYFFKFCELDPQFKIYLEIFLDEYKLISWNKYLVNILGIYIANFDKQKATSILNISDSFPDVINFLEDLSLDLNTYKKSIDFLSLREKPVFRLNKNDFLFLNLNFFVDKIYQAIQFDFARILFKNSATYKDKRIKSTADFMSIFGNVFSESGLFYSIMDYAFEKSGYKTVTGESIKKIIKEGEPDYYIRDKGKIYIFEFKNIYISGGIKHSIDYTQIKDEIFKKLVANQNNSDKGVTQLVNTIENIRAGQFEEVDSCDFESAIIYPIIVYVDFSFNLSGINFILNQEFRKQATQRNLKNSLNIKDLVLVDIDSFVKFQDLFRNKTLKLNNCLNEYFKCLRNTRDRFDRICSFHMFIHNKTRQMKHDEPKMLYEEVIKLLDAEQEATANMRLAKVGH